MRKLVLFAAPFAASSLLCCYAPSDRVALWLGGLCALLALPCLFLRGSGRRRALLILLGGAAGFLWFALWSQVFLSPAEGFVGDALPCSAVAVDYPQETSSGCAVDVELERGIHARLYLRGECDLRPGDVLELTAAFVRSDFLFGEENTHFSARGVFLLAYAEADEVHVLPAQRIPLRFLPRIWANELKESLDNLFAPEHAALLRAMLLGDKSRLGDGVTSFFNRSGLAHVLVVSGLHLSVLLQSLAFLLRGRKKLLFALGVPFLILFVLLVGATPSAIRAAVMNSLLLAAPLVRREQDSPTSLCLALFLLLLCNPYAAASVSLQLSFASVAGILLVSGPLYRRLKERTCSEECKSVGDRLLRVLWASLSTTAGALVFTTPVIAYWFRSVSLVSPLSNLLCLWAVGLLLPLGFLSALMGLLSPVLAAPFVFLVGLLCRYLLLMTELLGSFAFSALSMDSLYYRLWLGGIYLLLLLVFFLRKEREKKLILPLCAPVLLLCAAIFLTHAAHQKPSLTVTALDVGQGAATAFYSKGRTALVDCGGDSLTGAGDLAADHFQALGFSRLDLLVLTHLDDDHYNGVEQLFRRMDIKAVALPAFDDGYGRREDVEALAKAEGAQLCYVEDVLEISLGETVFTLLPPLGKGTTNEEGLFVLCSAGDFDTLITGDADSAVEAMLVKYHDLPDAELLLAGHHGSKNSTSSEFLDAVRPEYAVISAGRNSYGHPHSDTLARLDAAGAEVYRTDLHGSITLTVNKDGFAVTQGGS